MWAASTWPAINTWFGVDWPAIDYYYGDNITYVDNNVCLYGQPIATAADYYQSAADLAQTGEQADIPSEPPPPKRPAGGAPVDQANAQWLPLGVFEAIPGGEKSSKMTFQLAVNKDGIVRGNYYNTGDNNVQQVQGAVDKQTQRDHVGRRRSQERDLRHRPVQPDQGRNHDARPRRQRQDPAVDAGAAEAAGRGSRAAVAAS